MSTTLFSEFRTQAESYAGIPACTTTTNVILAVMNKWLNAANFRYQGILAECGMGFIAHTTGSETVMTGVTADITVTDLGMIVGVDIKRDTTRWDALPPIHPGDITDYLTQDSEAYGYLPQGPSTVTLYPKPLSGTYRVRYIATPTEITVDSTAIQDHFGWSQIIPLEAAIKARVQQEVDPTALMSLLSKVEADVDAKRMNRMLLTPGRVRDVQSNRSRRYLTGSWYPRGGF